ncbi:hypothetical protein L1887_62959 [Cichorium endivia]|nr:hypothetical protein L1887_62959 [Cichorium endivia]
MGPGLGGRTLAACFLLFGGFLFVRARDRPKRAGYFGAAAPQPSLKKLQPQVPLLAPSVPARFGVDTILDPNAQLAVSPSRRLAVLADSQSHRLARLYTVPCIGSLGLVYSRVAQLPLIPLVPQRASAKLPVDACRFDAVSLRHHNGRHKPPLDHPDAIPASWCFLRNFIVAAILAIQLLASPSSAQLHLGRAPSVSPAYAHIKSLSVTTNAPHP